jgi:hypothetical protein
MKYKQSIDNIFESNSDEWVMKNKFDDELYFKDEIPAIIDMIENKMNTKYDPSNPKIKKIMDVQLLKLIKQDQLATMLKRYNQQWTLTKKNNKIHLVVHGTYKGKPIIKENFTWIVIKDFHCGAQNLTTLKGCPEMVGRNFDCSKNKLVSLEHGPEYVNGDYYCRENKLKSLEHIQNVITGTFVCSENELTTLEGMPKRIEGYFECAYNKITSLKGMVECNGGIDISYNKITSLEYSPNIVRGEFVCNDNLLQTLDHCPSHIGGGFDCSTNDLQTLNPCPERVAGDFTCIGNHSLTQSDFDNIQCDIKDTLYSE